MPREAVQEPAATSEGRDLNADFEALPFLPCQKATIRTNDGVVQLLMLHFLITGVRLDLLPCPDWPPLPFLANGHDAGPRMDLHGQRRTALHGLSQVYCDGRTQVNNAALLQVNRAA